MRRRHLLASLGSVLALAGCAGSEGEPSPTTTHSSTDSTQTPTGGTEGSVTLSHHTEFAMAKLYGGNFSSSVIYLDATAVPVGGPDGCQFRVRDDTDNVVTVAPDEGSQRVLNGVVKMSLYTNNGSLLDDPELDFFENEPIPVSVSGDTQMFEDGAVFRPYTVEAFDDSGVVASTGPRTYGIGYESAVTQDSTSGSIELRTPVPDAYTDSWAVQLEISNYGADGRGDTQLKQVFEHQSGELVTSFDAESIAPMPEDGGRNSNLLFHVDGNTETTANLWAGFELELS